jgi:regulatory protein
VAGDPASGAEEVRDAAVRLLARREHSARELTRKLCDRGWPEDRVEAALAALAAEGLQSDARFAESFARQRAERGYGPRKIDAELRQRGVERDLIAVALEQVDVDFFESAADFYRRRYGEPDATLSYRERARRAQALTRRGFEPEHVRALVGD